MIFIFDIDGTIADISHRLHFIGATSTTFTPYDAPKDWDGFYKACVDDTPIWPVITVVRALSQAGHTIIFSTGRPEKSRYDTVVWLRKYRVPAGALYMRTDEDHREDTVVKNEFLNRILKDFDVTIDKLGGAFEDRQQMVDMYRKLGVKAFQVAEGKF